MLPTTISHRTEARLTLFDFEDEDIFKIIRSLNISKAYGYDDILIRMIKAWDLALVKALSMIFINCYKVGHFLIYARSLISIQFIKTEKDTVSKIMNHFYLCQ